MKLRIIIILLASLVNNCFAQTSKDICSSQTLSWNNKPASYTSVTEAKIMIADIIAVIGLKQNFEVMASDVDNAAAVIYNSKRYILYNPDFIDRLNNAAGNKWASISILAHEIGHHLNGHTLENIGSQPEKELEADEFSGFVLRRMGATLPEAQAAMKIAADYKKSLTHPGQADRLTAIANGWNTANKQQGGKDLAVNKPSTKIEKQNTVTKPVYDVQQNDDRQTAMQSNKERTVYNEQNTVRNYPVRTRSVEGNENSGVNKNILADINFTADEQSSFYLTSQFNIVKLINNRLYSIGKLQQNYNASYPFIITDDAGTKLWIDNEGNIINSNYRSVGFLKVRK